MAEREGFEPPDPCGSVVFKTTALNHSATSPVFGFLPTAPVRGASASSTSLSRAQRHEHTLSVFAKSPLRPLGHLSGVWFSTHCTRPWCVGQLDILVSRSAARTHVKCVREIPASPTRPPLRCLVFYPLHPSVVRRPARHPCLALSGTNTRCAAPAHPALAAFVRSCIASVFAKSPLRPLGHLSAPLGAGILASGAWSVHPRHQL
jgi:hypothetical protein